MKRTSRYVGFFENDDTISGLGRIIEEDGLWGESLVDGRWVRDDAVLRAIFSPGSDPDIICFDDAKAVANRLGVDFE